MLNARSSKHNKNTQQANMPTYTRSHKYSLTLLHTPGVLCACYQDNGMNGHTYLHVRARAYTHTRERKRRYGAIEVAHRIQRVKLMKCDIHFPQWCDPF